MKIMLLTLVLSLVSNRLQANETKTFSGGGFIICVFDHPAVITNHGSKLVVGIQDPTTHRWIGLPWKDAPAAAPWPRDFVDTDTPTDEVGSEGKLSIKKPVTGAFRSFKGGEIEVEFSTLPKRIKRMRKIAWSPS